MAKIPALQKLTHICIPDSTNYKSTASGAKIIEVSLSCKTGKGAIRGPGGPSVTAQGAHVSSRHSVSGAKTKQIKVPVEPPEAVSIPQITFMF